MAEAPNRNSSATESLLTLSGVRSDPTGVQTFERYLWQTKQAVRQWLTCLEGHDGPVFVACEHVEDLVLVYPGRLRFLQLKTRDRGSWSAAGMCSRGIDALARSYNAVRAAGVHQTATFELWLEGPIADSPATVDFVAAPTSAPDRLRRKIIAHGLRRVWLDDFLDRLVIRPDQPTRAHIDAKALWELGAVWPGLTRPELEGLYERLLSAATAAQAGSAQPATVHAHLLAMLSYIGEELTLSSAADDGAIDPIRAQLLSHGMLVALTPPLPTEPVEQLLARISRGTAASLLELKMAAAGAGSQTIERAQQLRADMEVQRQLLMSSRTSADHDLERLATRVLNLAQATASRIALTVVSNPVAGARPAEVISVDLLSRPTDLAHCDRDSVFDGDGELIYGYLGHLSDKCRFGWRSV